MVDYFLVVKKYDDLAKNSCILYYMYYLSLYQGVREYMYVSRCNKF